MGPHYLAPFAVRGTVCELGWEEIQSCNNGGGVRDRECKLTVESGIRDESTNTSTEFKKDKDDSTEVDTKKVDKTITTDVLKNTEFGVDLSVGIDGGQAAAAFTGGFTGSISASTGVKTTTKDQDHTIDYVSTGFEEEISRNWGKQ
ncbi:hypothetical protein AAVH_17170 [Aphelenchoides avenae]|nr:hypothetical protein AAVH_17170 [Aphelenchus avenae]